jgi:hypothetical protein
MHFGIFNEYGIDDSSSQNKTNETNLDARTDRNHRVLIQMFDNIERKRMDHIQVRRTMQNHIGSMDYIFTGHYRQKEVGIDRSKPRTIRQNDRCHVHYTLF